LEAERIRYFSFSREKIKSIVNILYIWNTWQSGVEGTELSLDTCSAEKEIEVIFKTGMSDTQF